MVDASLELVDGVEIIELGARDGLQGLSNTVDTLVRVNLIELLEIAGLSSIEVGAFALISGMSAATPPLPVLEALGHAPADRIRSVLVPHLNALDQAYAAGCRDITVTTAASRTFCRATLGCDIEENLYRITQLIEHARPLGIAVRVRVSTVIDCPFEGVIAPQAVAAIVARLQPLGCRQICLDDTTGSGAPGTVGTLLRSCLMEAPMHTLACHFHDTFGLANANVMEALEQGIRAFDSSISGLGGNPYFPGAAGNLATEELAYLLTGLGMDCGVDLDGLLLAGEYIDCMLDRRTESRVGRALRARNLPYSVAR
ncbi:MAG: hydroxymethylglutaryl-CoA lyase [Stenotrophomonas sp.]|uniref:hydroxymethylglutaryl-CoA lyase n=1 Tax=Stenotrophomonas sp. TaxID=69392 RepID=UPI003D6D1140